MTKLNERKIILAMAAEYRARLLEALSEVDVVDKEGNIIISKDLKVRHKKSGFEYTVAGVEGDGENIQIYLREPEDPRVENPGQEQVLSASSTKKKMLGEDDIIPLAPAAYEPAVAEEEDEDIFVVDSSEFEREYEVQ